MKTCRNCKSEIADDALFCPNCGCAVKRTGKTEESEIIDTPINTAINTDNEPIKKKRKTWLWVLGWMFIFPIPLTILLLKNQKINKTMRIVIIVIAWLFYLLIAMSNESNETETTKRPAETATQASETITESSEPATPSSENIAESSEAPTQVSETETESTESETEPSESTDQFSMATETENPVEENIESLNFSTTDTVTVKVGDSYTSGSLFVKVKNEADFSVEEDLIFVSDNPEIATLAYTEISDDTALKYEIIGVNDGETDVYVTSKNGNIVSEKIHVIVSEPINVESIELSDYTTDLVIGETVKISATIIPSDAEDKTLTWTSSEESVATVDSDGTVTAIGTGTATITVTSSNGIESSFDVKVNTSETLMKLSVSHPRDDDVNIGKEWSYEIQINGEAVSNTIAVEAGETLIFYAKFTEDDNVPDVGTAQTTYTVTEDDILNGFTVTMDLYVTENRGKNSGQSAHFIVTYKFSPID